MSSSNNLERRIGVDRKFTMLMLVNENRDVSKFNELLEQEGVKLFVKTEKREADKFLIENRPDIYVVEYAHVESPREYVTQCRRKDEILDILLLFNDNDNATLTTAVSAYGGSGSITESHLSSMLEDTTDFIRARKKALIHRENSYFLKYGAIISTLDSILDRIPEKKENEEELARLTNKQNHKIAELKVSAKYIYDKYASVSALLFTGDSEKGIFAPFDTDEVEHGQGALSFGIKTSKRHKAADYLLVHALCKENGIPMNTPLFGPFMVRGGKQTIVGIELDVAVPFSRFFPVLESIEDKETVETIKKCIAEENLRFVARYQKLIKKSVKPDFIFEEKHTIKDIKKNTHKKIITRDDMDVILDVYIDHIISYFNNDNHFQEFKTSKRGRIRSDWNKLKNNVILGNKGLSNIWFSKKLDNVPYNSGLHGFGKFLIEKNELSDLIEKNMTPDGLDKDLLKEKIREQYRIWDPSSRWAVFFEDFFMFIDSYEAGMRESCKGELLNQFIEFKKFNEKELKNIENNFPFVFFVGAYRSGRRHDLISRRYIKNLEYQFRYKGLDEEVYHRSYQSYLVKREYNSKQAFKNLAIALQLVIDAPNEAIDNYLDISGEMLTDYKFGFEDELYKSLKKRSNKIPAISNQWYSKFFLRLMDATRIKLHNDQKNLRS